MPVLPAGPSESTAVLQFRKVHFQYPGGKEVLHDITLELEKGKVYALVGPTVSSFKNSSARLLLAATPATIDSGIYQNAFRMIGKDIKTVAIPDLASAIEFGKTEEEIEQIIRGAFANVPLKDFNVLILACTHYPLVTHLFERVVGPISIFDPALAVGDRVKRQLWPREVGDGTTRFLISKDSQPFRDRVGALSLGESVIEVVE